MTKQEPLSSPRKKLLFDSPAKSASDSDREGGGNGSINNTTTSKSIAPVTSKMSRLFGSPSYAATVSSFFGSMSFLEKEDVFDDTFGLTPLILDTQPMKDTPKECLSRTHTYADKCMLDIFLEIRTENYVGGDYSGSRSKLVHEVCKQISII